jgi:hypothetical protein
MYENDYGDKAELSKEQNTTSNINTVNIKTGTNVVLLKNPPVFIKDAGEFEPLYPPQEFILEESLRREAERVAHQELLMNRVVYDSIDPSPYTGVKPGV